MEMLIALLALLIVFNFLLKQTGNTWIPVFGVGLVCGLFVGFSWPWAIEQSRTQISEWMADQRLMTDLTVLLTLDVFFQMVYCWETERMGSSEQPVSRWQRWRYRFLQWFPGVLFFPVLFSLLVSVIFSFPGISFPGLAWSLAVVVALVVCLGVWGIKRLLPERGLRLELLYQTCWLAAVLGFVTTISGQVTVAGISEVDWLALAGIGLFVLSFGLLGWMAYVWRQKRLRNKENDK